MRAPTRWYGPALGEDERSLLDMLDDFLAAHDPELTDDPETVDALIAELAELGVWTLGTATALGGGGAGALATTVTLERLGRGWPALGWAAVQAHAAVELLGSDTRFAELTGRIHAGTAAVAVIDLTSTHVALDMTAGHLTGTVARVDVAAENPDLLVLSGADTATLVAPAALSTQPVPRTGLGGAMTRTLTVDADGAALDELTAVDCDAARARLWAGAAAVAAGIAGAAADAAFQYARGREQFGAPLTELPIVRESLLVQRIPTTTLLSAAVDARHDVDRAHAVVRSACDAAIDVAASALQSHGGYGYLIDYPAARQLRDALSLRAAVDTWGAGVAMARRLRKAML